MGKEIDEKPKWYVLHTISGYENVAKQNLEMVVEKNNLKDRVFDIISPEEEVIEQKDSGKQVVVRQKVLPTYLLVKMIYGDDIWHTITRTRGITGFVGPKGRPLELTENEIMQMRLEEQKVDTSLALNDTVEIIGGPFDKVSGTVIELDLELGKAKVSVEMFGRTTPIDVSLNQIRKIN
ncbi:MAG: transcription termination/antitermination factor NusG [Clostridia bacterium]|nr:transcription termination/antitermination factor NusG [Clostridia bacterium]